MGFVLPWVRHLGSLPAGVSPLHTWGLWGELILPFLPGCPQVNLSELNHLNYMPLTWPLAGPRLSIEGEGFPYWSTGSYASTREGGSVQGEEAGSGC